MRAVRLVAAMLLAAGLWGPAGVVAAPAVLEATLDNGLRVLLLEDHRSPVASVQVWYRVGSRNERPGATGLAHFLEHMMFKGTQTHGKGEFARLVEQNGGQDNAFTSQDVTSYYVDIAADRVDLVLRLEADRMRHLLLDGKEIDSERQVVMEERRTRTEDDPESFLFEELSAVAFKAHPYRWPIIGWMEDIRRINPVELRAFYDTYYVPNNALLVVVGDVQAPALLERIRAIFGPVTRGKEPPLVTAVEPPQLGERRVSVARAEARLPVVAFAFQVPNHRSTDAPALELTAAILAEGRASRLYRRLVYDKQIALGAGGEYSYGSADPGLFWFYATPLPGHAPEAIEQALLEEIESLQAAAPPEEELQRAKNQIEASFVWRQDSVHSRASSLARFELMGSWRLGEGFVPAIRAVTAADVQRVARAYFPRERKSVGILRPVQTPPPPAAPTPAR
jgi:zinc protease